MVPPAGRFVALVPIRQRSRRRAERRRTSILWNHAVSFHRGGAHPSSIRRGLSRLWRRSRPLTRQFAAALGSFCGLLGSFKAERHSCAGPSLPVSRWRTTVWGGASTQRRGQNRKEAAQRPPMVGISTRTRHFLCTRAATREGFPSLLEVPCGGLRVLLARALIDDITDVCAVVLHFARCHNTLLNSHSSCRGFLALSTRL